MAEQNEQTPVTISGMIGGTYFANSPVVINISGFQFPDYSSMRVVKVWVDTSWEPETPVQPSEQEIAAVQNAARTKMEGIFGSSTYKVLVKNPNVDNDDDRTTPILSGSDVFILIFKISSPFTASYAVFATKDKLGTAKTKKEFEEYLSTLASMTFTDALNALNNGDYQNWFICAHPVMDVIQENLTSLFLLQRQYYIDAYTPPSAGDDEDLNATNETPFYAEVGADTSIDFDISTGLRALWANYTFGDELRAAQDAASGAVDTAQVADRACMVYKLHANTEWIDTDGLHEGQEYESSQESYGLLGGWTELERYTGVGQPNIESMIGYIGGRAAVLASTKPTETPEKIGEKSIVSEGMITYQDAQTAGSPVIHRQIFHPYKEEGFIASSFTVNGHTYVRDADHDYVDFLFINSRGAMESCSATMLKALNIKVDSQVYAHTERPTFIPSRSLLTLQLGGPRRDWLMSSGYQTREWAEWWTCEFLRARRCWMLVDDLYLPVTIEPAKNAVSIFDQTKQELPHIDFTVTLALEG